MMKIEKIIGEGSTAQVIVLDEKTVAKQFFERVSDSSIEHEYLRSKAVMDSGLPVPTIFEKVIHNGRTALLYERINGSPLTKKLSNQPWTALTLINQMAKLQVFVHDNEVSNFPYQKEILHRKIKLAQELTEAEKTLIAERLSKLPSGNSLCHGDFHPDNILLAERGPVIIDWADATQGTRLADLARTLIILRFGGLPAEMKLFKNKTVIYLRNLLAGQYLKSYRKSFHFTVDSLEKWILPVTAARLSESIPVHEKEKLVLLIRQCLKNDQYL
ncbi:aminoglycoside phosphotransferase family protein [Fictibacillus nanhaiensis]|uniref:aminoglycoside phosphotransferase family protein n=1 Tax=Fictibacillus nanhaiensis TaxID=742169 RepID=UPI00203EC189|nr:aminoglycoside phosphotransferase family protein [Fictibacillus nanhaiensis]MCM3733420.1 aminoglycoside phosphotransferase family protein [Fictibacillus nanhaiensis]